MGAPQERAPRRPNVVLILADDMGFSDIGSYGSEIETPNLDSLAAGGLRLSQMYNAARCCPTRAALLTGLYPHQTGVGQMVRDLGHPAYRGFLNDRCVTLAEALHPHGYRNYMSGKWHVGGHYGVDPEEWRPGTPGFPHPLDRGFDRFFGTLSGAGSYFNPHTLMRDRKFIAPEDDFYYTDAIGSEAAAMVGDAARSQSPFFLYVAYTAPHWPLHALPEDVAKYRGRYRDGWDAVRAARWVRLQRSGMLSSDWRISPRDETAPPWDDLPDWPDKDWEDARMAVYAAQVDRMDLSIGTVLAALREHDLERDTLVIFLSDNGGCAEFLREDGKRESAPPLTRAGRRVHAGNVRYLLPGPADTYMSYELPWANASNTPFRLYKHWVHEGGIATPFIAHWPGVIPAGGIAHSTCHVIDLMTTCLDAAGVPYPSEHNGVPVTPLEGESLLPLFRGDLTWARDRALCWEHVGNRAVRQGKWKLVSKFPGDWELYDMERDRTELDDLSAAQAGVTRELAALYDAWAARCGVVPWDQLRPNRRQVPSPSGRGPG